MYAEAFFSLLKSAYRIRAKELLELTSAISSPHLEKSDRQRYIKELERATKEPEQLLINPDDYSELERLKKLL
jgi:hypothetical protein